MDGKKRGRQKIKLVKIQNESHLQVTFSKRRGGVFKKANELASLCAAQVAIFVFSPGKKAFSFGHPNVESVVDRFLSPDRDPRPRGLTEHLLEALRDASVRELNNNLTHVECMLESQKKRGERLNEQIKAAQGRCHGYPWGTPLDELNNLEQLEQLKAGIQELKVKVAKQVAQGLTLVPVLPPQTNPLEGSHCHGLPFYANAAEFDGWASASTMPREVGSGHPPGYF